MQVSVCGMCRFLSVSCAGFSVRYVQSLVCVMCGFKCVLCAVSSMLCAVCRHEPRRFAPSMHRFAR